MSILNYLKQTKAELTHVVWPTRSRAIAYTVIFIVISVAIGYGLGGIDALLKTGLKALILK